MFRLTSLLLVLWLPTILFAGEELSNFFFWRHQLIMLTGILSLGYMSCAVLLAARFSWMESIVKGLDKGYALHKKLGIGATITLILHWASVKSAHWLVDAGLIARPERGAGPGHGASEGINLHAIAEQVGDITFKVFLVFAIISLVQAISYKQFKFTHKIGGALMIAGVFHALILLDWGIASLPMNIAIIAMSVMGVYCSWLSLRGSIGKDNKSSGVVTKVERFVDLKDQPSVVRFAVQLEKEIDYKEGQFAYLNFNDGEAPHPFSILNYDNSQRVVEFGVKDLGDYTHKLVNQLKQQQKVTVEGSYGRFQISNHKHQVWIGAGIGIVPFISRLYWLKANSAITGKNINKIELFYCVNSRNEAFFEKEIIALLANLPFIELHIFDASKGELLEGHHIVERMGSTTYDVSFCGPINFSNKLKQTLFSSGLTQDRFHNEIFKMR